MNAKPLLSALSVYALSLFAVLPCFGAERKLFNLLGGPVWRYDQVVSQLAPGDVLNMGDGNRFNVRGVLARTPNTVVVDIGDGRVVRLPASRHSTRIRFLGMPMGTHNPMKLITSTLEGYERLREFDAPTVRIFPELSRAGAYVVTEKLEIRFLLSALLQGRLPAGISVEEQARIEDEFVEFAARFWPFAAVGDARPDQVAYTSRGWVLFDWTHQHKLVHSNDPDDDYFKLSQENGRAHAEYFGSQAPINERLYRPISARVLEARSRNRDKLGYSCARLLLGPLLRQFD